MKVFALVLVAQKELVVDPQIEYGTITLLESTILSLPLWLISNDGNTASTKQAKAFRLPQCRGPIKRYNLTT